MRGSPICFLKAPASIALPPDASGSSLPKNFASGLLYPTNRNDANRAPETSVDNC